VNLLCILQVCLCFFHVVIGFAQVALNVVKHLPLGLDQNCKLLKQVKEFFNGLKDEGLDYTLPIPAF
jgi:hypothetical protein